MSWSFSSASHVIPGDLRTAEAMAESVLAAEGLEGASISSKPNGERDSEGGSDADDGPAESEGTSVGHASLCNGSWLGPEAKEGRCEGSSASMSSIA